MVVFKRKPQTIPTSRTFMKFLEQKKCQPWNHQCSSSNNSEFGSAHSQTTHSTKTKVSLATTLALTGTSCGYGSLVDLCLRLAWKIFELVAAITTLSIPPLSNTRWEDEVLFIIARLVNTLKHILRYNLYIFLVVFGQSQELIHPKLILSLAVIFFLEHFFEWRLCFPQCSHRWKSKH